jgi:hypothetical protein
VFEQCQNCGAIGIGGIIWVVAFLITTEIVSINSRKNKGFIKGIIKGISRGIMGIHAVIITGPLEYTK